MNESNESHIHEFGEKCPVCITGEIIQIFKKEKKYTGHNGIIGPGGRTFYETCLTNTPPHCESCKLVFYKQIDLEKISEIEKQLKEPGRSRKLGNLEIF